MYLFCYVYYKPAVFPQVNDSIDGLLRQVSQLKGQTSPRLRKLSVSKMFNQLMNRTSSGGSHQEHRAVMPRVSIRDRARKRGHIRQSWGRRDTAGTRFEGDTKSGQVIVVVKVALIDSQRVVKWTCLWCQWPAIRLASVTALTYDDLASERGKLHWAACSVVQLFSHGWHWLFSFLFNEGKCCQNMGLIVHFSTLVLKG